MNRALRRGTMLMACLAYAGMAWGASPLGNDSAAGSAQSPEGTPPAQEATPLSGTPLPSMGAEEPRHLPSTEVRGYREVQQKCDRARGTGQAACRAQLAAKYAEIDHICRIVSPGTELPVCIKSAYAAD